jgi:hypothetical protein
VQPGKGKLHLRFDADRTHDPRVRGALGGVTQQGRLSDARLAAEHEYGTPPGMRTRQELIDSLALGASPGQGNHYRAG